MHIAFVTSEYPSELPDAGGLGTYVHRMAKLLIGAGHEPEVFVASKFGTQSLDFDGVPTHRVDWSQDRPVLHFVHRASSRLLHSDAWRASFAWAAQAWALAVALEVRHRQLPFDFVQSADYLASGLFVKRRVERVHAVRCSTAADLYSQCDGDRSATSRVRGYLERRSMQRADIVFAPSRFISDYFRTVHRMSVAVIRPPVYLERQPSAEGLPSLPPRFFLHFGQLIDRKGTALLAAALPVAWKAAPDLTMVWSGVCWSPDKLQEWRSLWGDRQAQVVITGPLKKPYLYAVLQRADAAVLPSQVDNLPNTVIESLMFGIPVLGSRGASIDELVEEGRTGLLSPIGDVTALAGLLVRQWQGLSPVRKGFAWDSAIAKEMQPGRAAAGFLSLAAGRSNPDNCNRSL